MAKTEDVNVTIEKHIGVLSKNEKSNWQKELNLVSWNDNPAKYDIRDWSPEHDKMSKGITLSNEEITALKSILTTI